MTWVLIIFFWGDAVTTQEFHTRSACENALIAIDGKSGVSPYCVPKGDSK